MEPKKSPQNSTKSTYTDLLKSSSYLPLKILHYNRIKATGSILSALKISQMGHSAIKQIHQTLSEDLDYFLW